MLLFELRSLKQRLKLKQNYNYQKTDEKQNITLGNSKSEFNCFFLRELWFLHKKDDLTKRILLSRRTKL